MFLYIIKLPTTDQVETCYYINGIFTQDTAIISLIVGYVSCSY